MNDPKITGWDVALTNDETVIMLYDPWREELKELGRWGDSRAALLKGELGRIYGPTFRADPT